ncbi:hypothetical protein GCM10027440_45290 [Nocardiopsis coralliicola]
MPTARARRVIVQVGRAAGGADGAGVPGAGRGAESFVVIRRDTGVRFVRDPAPCGVRCAVLDTVRRCLR